MIECFPNSTIDVDKRVIHSLTVASGFHRLKFDATFLAELSAFHGGVPTNPFFNDSTGALRQIAWFVPLVDEHSTLAPPHISPFSPYDEQDARVCDRAMPAIINDEVCPFHFGERIIPIAALYTDSSPPLTLRLHTMDSPTDSVCFDRSTDPHSIVYCNGADAADRAVQWDDGDLDEFTYDFLIPISNCFRTFATMLRATR